jgi:hypothetical protein
LDGFSDFADFPLNFRFLEEVEWPQKRASRAAGWPTLLYVESYYQFAKIAGVVASVLRFKIY